MRGQKRNHPTLERGRVGLAVGDAEGVLVGRFDFEDQIEVRLSWRGRGVVHDRPVGEGRIPRGEGRPVVPAHIFTKAEDDLRFGEKRNGLAHLEHAASVGSEPFFDFTLESGIGAYFKSHSAFDPDSVE